MKLTLRLRRRVLTDRAAGSFAVLRHAFVLGVDLHLADEPAGAGHAPPADFFDDMPTARSR